MVTASVWLEPTDDERARRLSGAIVDLAAALDGPVFAPHLTVVTLHDASEADWAMRRDSLRRLWADVGPVEAHFAPLTTSAERFRSAILPVEPAPWIDDLRAFGEEVGVDVLPVPHVSLAYVVPEPRRDAVLRAAGDLPPSVTLERLTFVPHDPTTIAFHPEPL